MGTSRLARATGASLSVSRKPAKMTTQPTAIMIQKSLGEPSRAAVPA